MSGRRGSASCPRPTYPPAPGSEGVRLALAAELGADAVSGREDLKSLRLALAEFCEPDRVAAVRDLVALAEGGAFYALLEPEIEDSLHSPGRRVASGVVGSCRCVVDSVLESVQISVLN